MHDALPREVHRISGCAVAADLRRVRPVDRNAMSKPSNITAYDVELAAFVKDRDAALLTLDETVIRAFGKKYDMCAPIDPEVFWRGVHKARTAIVNFPADEKA